MDKEAKKLWVEALRSGEYEQGQGMLCKMLADGTEEYCCLGVLCEVAIAQGVNVRKADPDFDPGTSFLAASYGEDCPNTGTLPIEVQIWARLEEEDPKLGFYSAINYNDGYNSSQDEVRPHTFDEIAELIEEHL
jgi:hypothetical protein